MVAQDFAAFLASIASRTNHWRLGETSGTAAANQESGPAGVYTGGYTLNQTGLITGDAAGSVLLNGTSGYVAIPHGASLDLGDTFSVILPIKRTRTSHTDYEVIASQGGNVPWLFINTNNTFGIGKFQSIMATSTAGITDTARHLLTFTKNAGTALKVYLDAVDVTGTVTNQTITTSGDALHLGTDSPGIGNYLGAYLQDYAIFSTALSQAQVTDAKNLMFLGPLTAGTLAAPGTVTSTTVTLSWAAATGGTAPYVYQVQRAPDVAGSAGTYANIGAPQSGLTYLDNAPLAPSTKYWWRVNVSDTEVTPQTVTSNAVTTTTSAPPSGESAAVPGRTLAATIQAHASIGFYHEFNELSGTAAIPTVTGTGGTNGTYVGATLAQPGALANAPNNKAVSLPGTVPNRVWFPDRAAFNSLTPTYWMVVKPTILSFGYQALVNKGAPGAGIWIQPDGTILVAVLGVGQFAASTIPLPAVNTFYVLSWQYNGTTVNRLALNNVDVTGSPAFVAGFAANANALTFGTNPTGDDFAFPGTYDEFALFTAAVSNAFLTDLYNLVTLGPLTAPVVTVVSTTSTDVNLSWPAATGGTAPYLYQVQRAPDVSGSPGTWANVGAQQSGLTKTDTGRTASTLYHYRVQAIGSEVTPQTASSASVPATTGGTGDVTPPVVTLGVAGGAAVYGTAVYGTDVYGGATLAAVTDITATTATVNTSTNEPAQVWVEWGTASGNYAAGPGSWKPAATATIQAFPLSGLPSSTIIHWRVKGRDASSNESTFSADQTFTTLAGSVVSTDPPLVLSGPTLSARALTDPTATVTWTTDVPTRGQVRNGAIDPSLSGAYARVTDWDVAADALTTTHVITFPLIEGATNYWQIASVTAAGIETLTPGPATIVRTAVPPVVTNVTVTPGPTSAVVSWTTDEDTVEDLADYGTTPAFGSQSVITGVFPAGAGHSVTLSPLASNTPYQGQVRSRDAAGAQSAPVAFSFITQSASPTPPPAPTGLALVVAGLRVDLSWQDNATTETSQVVERATGAGSFGQLVTLGSDVTTYADTTVVAGVTYSWRVKAVNATGSSAYSNVINATIPAASLPAAASGLAVIMAGLGLVRLTWQDNSNNELTYEVERATAGATGPYTRVAILGPNAVTWDDGTVAPSTIYWWRVRPTNAVGAGAYSNVATLTTPPAPEPPPPNEAAAAVEVQVFVDWDNDGDFEDAYEDVSDDVLATVAVTSTRGRDQVRSLAPPMAGSASATLDNESRIYSPQWQAGPLYGSLLPGCTVRHVAQRPGTTATYSSVVLADAPAGWWRLGQTSGTTATDSSGNGRHGTYQNTPTLNVLGALVDDADGAVGLNGTNEYISVPDHASFAGPLLSAECWVWWDGPQAAAPSLINRRTTPGNVGGFSLEISAAYPAGPLNFYVHAGGVWNLLTGPALGWRRWTHIIATYDGTTARLYVDGALAASLTIGAAMTAPTSPVVEFGRNIGNAAYCLKGRLDEVALYSTVLSAARAREHYVAGMAGRVSLFTGNLDDLPQQPAFSEKMAGLPALGSLARLRGVRVSTSLYQNLSTDYCLNLLLDAAGWPTAARRTGVGATTVLWWWLDDRDAFDAAVELLNTEGPGAALYEDGEGNIVFEGRHHRLTAARSLLPQAAFVEGNQEPYHLDRPEYNPNLKSVINACSAEARLRTLSPLEVVWTYGATVTLGANETRPFKVNSADGSPIINAVVPGLGIDLTVTSGSLNYITLNRSSGGNVTMFIQAGATGAVATGLQLRAQRVILTNTVRVSNRVDTSTSRARHGERSYTLQVWPEVDPLVAQDFCDAVVNAYQSPRATLAVWIPAFLGGITADRALDLRISDRIAIENSQTGLHGEAMVEQVEYVHQDYALLVRLGCEQTSLAATNYAVWGSSGGGVVGAGWNVDRWGY